MVHDDRGACISISISCWNGNGSFWSLSGLLYDALGSSDILLITETHESLVRPLLDITGYHQFSACRQETRSLGGIKGSGGVACFVRDSLWSRISLVASNVFARFMWV
jgi:hypothetical protein